jgi:hypothetical protein
MMWLTTHRASDSPLSPRRPLSYYPCRSPTGRVIFNFIAHSVECDELVYLKDTWLPVEAALPSTRVAGISTVACIRDSTLFLTFLLCCAGYVTGCVTGYDFDSPQETNTHRNRTEPWSNTKSRLSGCSFIIDSSSAISVGH